jgi:hypothetical protein
MREEVIVLITGVIIAIAFNIGYLLTTIQSGNILPNHLPILLAMQFIIYTILVALICELLHMIRK